MKFEIELFRSVSNSMELNQDRDRAIGQQKYMKSKLPFWGIKMPQVRKLTDACLKKNPLQNNIHYRNSIRFFFNNAKKREEWYAAAHIAQRHKNYICESNLDIYLEMIMTAQWWDIVDSTATLLVGPAIKESIQFRHYIKSWIIHDNFWIRRTAILSQLKYKEDTNEKLLYSIILKCADEKEFFIRKAIGWGLREYAKTNPKSVKKFVENNENNLSNLSKREALKHFKTQD